MKSAGLFLVLGVLALAAVAGSAFLGRPEPASKPTGLGEKLFPSIDTAATYAIHFQRGEERLEITRETDGYWELPGLDGFPASDRVNGIPDLFTRLQIDDRLPARPEDLAAYSLTETTATRLQLRDQTGKSLVDLLVGGVGPYQRGAFFRRPGRTEALLTFDGRLSTLPLNPLAWARLRMGHIDPTGMLIEVHKPGRETIRLMHGKDQWLLQSLHRDAQGVAQEDPDWDRVREIANLAGNLYCDGVFPAATEAKTLGFGEDQPYYLLNNAAHTVAARVNFGAPQSMPELIAADGRAAGGPIVPMLVHFQATAQAEQNPYDAWFNRKTAGRIFWIRQSTQAAIFLPYEELTVPKAAAGAEGP